jgi:hypothetical protein
MPQWYTLLMSAAISSSEQSTFFDTVREVSQRSRQLLMKCVGREMQIDYVSVYPETAEAYERACREAEAGGQFVYDKNGKVYRMETAEGASIIRIRNPYPANGLLGCADFVVDDYAALRNKLLQLPNSQELHKEGYNIVEVTDPELAVAIYFPSQRMTQFLMGITPS